PTNDVESCRMSSKRSAATDVALAPAPARGPRERANQIDRARRRRGARSPSAAEQPVPAEVAGSSAADASTQADWPRVSFVIPGLNESESLPELAARITKAMEGGEPYEIIFVDDGSTDPSWKVITEMAEKDRRIKGARLRHNFGKAMALKVGFRRAR